MARGATLSPSGESLVTHARQSGVADRLVDGALAGIKGYKNPVIRLLAANAFLSSEDRIRAERQAAVIDLRDKGWTWQQIGDVIGTGRQRAWQIGHGL